MGVLLGAAMSHAARRVVRTDRAERLLHPVVLAAATAAVLAALAWRHDDDLQILVVNAALAIGCVPLSAIDLTERRLPTWLLVPLYPLLIALITMHGFATEDARPALRAVAGMALLFVFFLAIAVLAGHLGAGDVRLAGVLGLVLAWHSWNTLALGTLLGFLTAAVAGRVAAVAFRWPRNHPIPLGAALIAGAFAALLIHPAGIG